MRRKPRDHRFEVDSLLLVVRYKGEQTFETKSWQSSFFQTREDYTVHVFKKGADGGLTRLGSLAHVRPSPGKNTPRDAAVDALAFAYQPNWYEWSGSEDYEEGQDYPYDQWSPSNKRWFRLHESFDWQTLPQDKAGEFRVRSAR